MKDVVVGVSAVAGGLSLVNVGPNLVGIVWLA